MTPRSGRIGSLAAAWVTLGAILAGCEKPAVQVVAARSGVVESTATSVEAGVVKARRDSILSTVASGRIVEVYHKKGDRVKVGEPLIRLENEMERIVLEEAQISLKRLKTLGPANGASDELLDQARFAVDRAQVMYERTFVRAPFNGVLIELNANLGELSYGTMPLNLVMGGKKGNTEETLARVIDDADLYVEADIDEADAGRLAVCQPARITFDALGGRTLPARLSRISRAVSTAEGRSRTVRVELDLKVTELAATVATVATASAASADLPAPTLLVGMSADVEVVIDRVEGAVSVPTLTVLEGEDEKSVFVVEDGKLRKRRVKVGAANWDITQIKEGLKAGDKVVVPTDRRKLIEGQEVRTELREEAGKSEPSPR